MIFETYESFSPHARELRKHFEKRFSDPHTSSGDRFVWDYWHIPNEYTFLRTPAFHYFPKRMYEKFHRHLVNWGREHLGCHDVSPTWLSCYVEGCRQHWHKDEPHGPLAFVLSLTKHKNFKGGRTIIQNGRSPIKIEPKFNRLILFDPSKTHGVDEVKGVLEPRAARLVLHGWFVNPRVFWQGRLNESQVFRVLGEQLEPEFARFGKLNGFCSWRLHIQNGRVKRIELLAETVHKNPVQLKALEKTIEQLQFPKVTAILTLPLVFR
jgi:hypothetical protein